MPSLKRYAATLRAMLVARGVMAVLLCAAMASSARAQADGEALPVIGPGRESEILALLSPYADKDIIPGWQVDDIKAGERTIEFVLKGPNAASASLRLDHPKTGSLLSQKTRNFALTRTVPDGVPGAKEAVEKLAATVAQNDRGDFWPKHGPIIGDAKKDGVSTHGDADTRHGSSSAPFNYERAFNRVETVVGDGVFLFIAALVFLFFHLRRVLRDAPPYAWPVLVGIVVVGGLARIFISREAPMNAWPYERVVPVARHMFEGVVLPSLSQLRGIPIYLTEVIFKVDLLIAIVTPLAFFAHARYVTRDLRSALVAAGIFAVLPNHIHFSRADSEFIQSLASSSLTFIILYTAMREESRRWRILCYILLPLFSVATYFVRPENMFFYAVDLGGIALTAGKEVTRRRKVIAIVEVTFAAAFAFMKHLMVRYKSNVQQGLSLETLEHARSMIFDLRLNTLLNYHITPPGLVLLAFVGAYFLWKRGEGIRALFFTTWLLGFFLVHSYVHPTEALMQARYHLHLITPLLMLVASATPEILSAPIYVPSLIAVYLALSPLLHLHFERDIDFNEMHEFLFLRDLRPRIPEGCTVLEFSPAVDVAEPSHLFASRLQRMGTRLLDGVPDIKWKIVNPGLLAAPGVGPDDHEVLTAEAQKILEHPPECLMVYEGLSCASHRPESSPMAPVCQEMHARLDLVPVDTVTFGSRVYDEINAGRVITKPDGRTDCKMVLHPGDPVTLTMYRAHAKKGSAAPTEVAPAPAAPAQIAPVGTTPGAAPVTPILPPEDAPVHAASAPIAPATGSPTAK